MKELCRVFIPGIWNNNWAEHAALLTKQAGHTAMVIDPISGFLANWFVKYRVTEIKRKLVELSRAYTVDTFTHSQGCMRALVAMQNCSAIVRTMHLIAAACPEDCRTNGINDLLHEEPDRLGNVVIYVSPVDETLRKADSWIGQMLGFNDLGRVGPKWILKDVAPRVRVVRRNFGHSEWLEPYNLRGILASAMY